MQDETSCLIHPGDALTKRIRGQVDDGSRKKNMFILFFDRDAWMAASDHSSIS